MRLHLEQRGKRCNMPTNKSKTWNCWEMFHRYWRYQFRQIFCLMPASGWFLMKQMDGWHGFSEPFGLQCINRNADFYNYFRWKQLLLESLYSGRIFRDGKVQYLTNSSSTLANTFLLWPMLIVVFVYKYSRATGPKRSILSCVLTDNIAATWCNHSFSPF
jgi:hypothetical protein